MELGHHRICHQQKSFVEDWNSASNVIFSCNINLFYGLNNACKFVSGLNDSGNSANGEGVCPSFSRQEQGQGQAKRTI